MSDTAKFAAIMETLAEVDKDQPPKYTARSADPGSMGAKLVDLYEFVVGRDGNAGFVHGCDLGMADDLDSMVVMTIVNSRFGYDICDDIKKLVKTKGAEWMGRT